MNGMNKTAKLKLCLLTLLSFGLAYGFAVPAKSIDNDTDFEGSKTPVDKLATTGYVTWWAHESNGYHPMILVRVKNYSAKNLSGELIRFQCKFTDLTSGIVRTGKKEVMKAFESKHEIFAVLRNPQAYDLAIDEDQWPTIECKVLCRVGDVGDEGTQTLLVTRVDKITMTEQEAFERMSRLGDLNRQDSSETGRARQSGVKPGEPEKPMVAKAGKLPGAGQKKKVNSPNTMSYLTGHKLPGLGDDFYQFEKTYGLPAATTTADQGWTWARYRNSEPPLSVIAGSKGKSGKVDVIIVEMPDAGLNKDVEMTAIAKALSGELRSQKPGAPARSVRYLPGGRMQLLTCNASGYHSAFFSSEKRNENGSQSFFVLSRVPGNLVDLITEHGKHAALVQPAAAALGGS